MKRYYIMALAGLMLCLNACKEDTGLADAEGRLRLSVDVSDKVEVVSRTITDEEQTDLNQNCKVRIYRGESLVQKYQGIENIPASIALVSGEYSVRVTAGDSVAASFDQRFFEGKKGFTISKGETSTVEVNCGIVNTVVAITWDESLKEVFKDGYQVTVTSATGELVFSSANADQKGYFSLPEDNRKLICKFSATKLNGEKYENSTELTELKSGTLYNLTYRYTSPEQNPTGGAAITIQIDETPLQEEEFVITLKQRPVITCVDGEGVTYDLEHPVFLEPGVQKDFYFQIATSSPLVSLVIQNDRFTEWGFDANQFDMLQLNGQDEALKSLGLSVADKNSTLNGDNWKVLFAQSLISKMTATGNNSVTNITATDTNGKTRTVVWDIIASDVKVITEEILPYEVWTSKATLHGTVVGTLNSAPRFRYRVKETTDWTIVDADLTEQSFSKEISGLVPGTTYEYQAMDGEQASSVVCEFTTEDTFQPENAGFEYTSGSSPILIYGDGQSMWWDTGNHGSSTLGVNVTTPDTSVKHGGKQSILLSSQYVGLGIFGKFAAGNLFVGQFISKDGTDGILGWGRPCTSRPKALKVWVRYEPGTVDYNHTGTSLINKGDMDKGIIYVAVGDWAGQEANGMTWPFVVRTKNQASLFSTEKGTYSGDGTIAYGEKTFDEAYKDGENLVELTINLDYDNYGGNKRKPTSIIIVASASKYGDYFAGSTGSKMWLDDMELIYE